MASTYKIHNPPSVAETEQDLAWCFGKWGVRDYTVDYNVPRARLNNRTLSPLERAVTVRWMPKGSNREVVVSSDDQASVAANLRKLYLGIDAMRLNERRGLSEVMRSAYMQLPAASDHWTLLGLLPGSSADDVRRAYREQARAAHPDSGGSDEQMAALNRARDAALRETGA